MCLGCGVWRTPPVNLKQNQELKKKKVGEKSFRLDDLFLHHGKKEVGQVSKALPYRE